MAHQPDPGSHPGAGAQPVETQTGGDLRARRARISICWHWPICASCRCTCAACCGYWGDGDETSSLASFLMFYPGYCQQLIKLGYLDTLNERRRVEAFLGIEEMVPVEA